MKNLNQHNFSIARTCLQPEDQDPFLNLHVSYAATSLHSPRPESAMSCKAADNKLGFLNHHSFKQQPKRQEISHYSPRSRDFLRHTTYNFGRVQPIQKRRFELSTSLYSNETGKKTSTYSYENSEYYNQSLPGYTSHLKTYGNQAYDKLARKVHNTASFIEELKKFKQDKTKVSDPSKYSFATLETELSQEIITPAIDDDNGFRKKLYQNFYTPKPQATATVTKIKRDFTPNQVIKKVVSPSNKKSVTIKDFILETKLGGGKFGTVWKAYHIKSRCIYALKKIPKKMIKDHLMVDQFALEVKIQSFLRHQNILEIYGVFDDSEHVYLILEYMEDGTLYSELKKKKKLEERETAIKMKQVAKAIVYMHENGIVHRDIKPENIVVSGAVCKVCDFGWATICQDRRKTYCGTFDYAAPEILEGAEYDLSVDLWCLGVLTYELLVGKAPFYNISRKQTISNIINVENKKIHFPACLSQNSVSFITALLKKNPEERMTYEQLLEHPFLKLADENKQ